MARQAELVSLSFEKSSSPLSPPFVSPPPNPSNYRNSFSHSNVVVAVPNVLVADFSPNSYPEPSPSQTPSSSPIDPLSPQPVSIRLKFHDRLFDLGGVFYDLRRL